MNWVWTALCFSAAALACALGTGVLIKALHRASLLDQPNERSLHDAPVPRGGGLAVAGVTLAVQGVLALGHSWNAHTALVTSAVAAGFAALGFADDRASRSVEVRLGIQVVLALVFVLFALPRTSPIVQGLLCLSVLWAVNLFNFMDGADGLASTQTLGAGLGLAALFGAEREYGLACASAGLAGASLGFLRWNWTPAHIFLGDVGSYFMGFELAALVLLSGQGERVPYAALVLCAPFITDATLTLASRALRGVPVWRPHREHIYQRLVLRGHSPARIAAGLALILVGLCWPAAALTHTYGAAPAISVFGLLTMMWLLANRAFPLR